MALVLKGRYLNTKGIYISQPFSIIIGIGKFISGPTLRDVIGRYLMAV
jgi:hypothetical protein